MQWLLMVFGKINLLSIAVITLIIPLIFGAGAVSNRRKHERDELEGLVNVHRTEKQITYEITRSNADSRRDDLSKWLRD